MRPYGTGFRLWLKAMLPEIEMRRVSPTTIGMMFFALGQLLNDSPNLPGPARQRESRRDAMFIVEQRPEKPSPRGTQCSAGFEPVCGREEAGPTIALRWSWSG